MSNLIENVEVNIGIPHGTRPNVFIGFNNLLTI